MSLKVLKSAKTRLGNVIQLVTDCENSLTDSKKVLIIGVFHGDEPQGKYLIEKYLTPSKSKISVPLQEGDNPALYRYTNKYEPNYTQIAKILRNNMTEPEIILWHYIRNRQVNGIKFRRQQQIGKYICDFVSLEKKIVIELDGGQHNTLDIQCKDKERDEYLKNCGYSVIRFWNDEIINNLEMVLNKIYDTVNSSSQGKSVSLIPRGVKLFIPCLNPDGMQLNQRTNSSGVDLNRNFPTKNWGEDTSAAGDNPLNYFCGNSPASEIETRFLVEIIEEYKPNLILTLHAPYKIINFDGPAEDISQKISDIIGYPVEPSIGYPTPGSFGTYCGVERNIPTVTLELDENVPVDSLVKPVFKIFDLL